MSAEGATDDRRSGSGWRSRAHRGRLHRRAKRCLPHARRSRLSAGGATRVSRLPPRSGSRPPPSVDSRRLGLNRLSALEPASRSVATSPPLPTRSSTSASKNSAGSIGLVTGSPATAPAGAAPAGSDGEYVHLAVDGHSRPAYSEILPDEKRSSLPALSVQRPALLSQPRRQGRARHDDNGSSFRSRRYAKALRLLRIRHLRIKPYAPKSNGKPSASSRPACANGPAPAPAALPTRAPVASLASPLQLASPHGGLKSKPPTSRLTLTEDNLFEIPRLTSCSRAEPVARPFVQVKARVARAGRAEPHARRATMGKHSEVFVAFDVAKKKHAVAVAEGGRTGEVRFIGDIKNSPLPIERTIKRLAER